MSKLNEVRKLAQCIEFELGPPWLLCNNCETSVELNLRAMTHGVQVFAPLLAERGVGRGDSPDALLAALHETPNRYGSGRTLMLRKCVSLPGSCPCKANVPLPKSRSSSPGLRCE